uniref:Uncharacterized protein n=1 Tax=Lygus hesperus TaxID=30085 RepID=A0A0K8TCK1_LYGHE
MQKKISVLEKRKGVTVWPSPSIEIAIVPAHPPGPVLFRNQMNWTGPLTLRWAKKSTLQEGIHLRLSCSEFMWGQSTRRSMNRATRRVDVVSSGMFARRRESRILRDLRKFLQQQPILRIFIDHG